MKHFGYNYPEFWKNQGHILEQKTESILQLHLGETLGTFLNHFSLNILIIRMGILSEYQPCMAIRDIENKHYMWHVGGTQ